MTSTPVGDTHAIPSSSTNPKEKKKTICGGCEKELASDHPGIQCIQGHHFCMETCSKQIVSLFFSDPQLYIPLRCIQCHIELNTGVFERQLTPEQLVIYNQNMFALVWAKAVVGPDERLDNCPFCSYAVVRSIYDRSFLFCQHDNCHIASCIICRKALPKFENDYVNDAQQTEIFKHFTCINLADDKYEFESAVENGQKVSCPKCGLAGMKDDSCTHMTCPTCSQIWCYFCGQRVEDCDKSPGGTNSIFDHNSNWHINSKRCPMYFTQIQDLDERWPDNEEQCLMMFHRNRSIRFLREVYNKLGKERIDALNQHFNILDSCGFTIDEILNEDLTLIKGRDRTRR